MIATNDHLIQFKWFHLKSTTYYLGGYAYTNLKFANGDKFTAGMHRLIMGDEEPYEGWAEEYRVRRYLMSNGKILFKGDVSSGGNKRKTVDHKDGDGLNNTRANLIMLPQVNK